MDYSGFITTVRDEAHISADEAEKAACATLKTLSERISAGEAEDIAERLPPRLQSCLDPDGPPERFHVDEFLRRIAERVGIDEQQARRDVKAVFTALWRSVGPEEVADVRSELPKDFDALLDEVEADAPPPPVSARPALSYDEFLERVKNRAHVNQDKARTAVDAVLEALATRISAGQIEDLEQYLPEALHPALERGRAKTANARPRPLSVEAFLGDVAERAGVDKGAAAIYARAVFATLREAVPRKEFEDSTAQLPGEYNSLLKQG